MYRATATSTATANKKPYCKVCQDSGKSEKEYTSHWVKDLSGKVICPTLLTLECRCCYKFGHTVKFCPVNLKRNERSANAVRAAKFRKEQACVKSVTKVAKPVNVYDLLDADEDEELEVAEVGYIAEEIADVDECCVKVTTWADIAAMSKETANISQNTLSSLSQLTKNATITNEEKTTAEPVSVAPIKKPIFKYSWADWPSDSEDEDNDY